MLARLRFAGVVGEKVEDGYYGRFAWMIDLESSRMGLWERESK
jgi:hypothetical protein